jgi:hypothetical protein
MIEFNPDGSIKLPNNILTEKNNKMHRMTSSRCASIKKQVVNAYPPKKCLLEIEFSKLINNIEPFYNTINQLKYNLETPIKILTTQDNELKIEISTNFRRCSDCSSIIERLRDMLDGNVILDKGNCTLKEREFCYEDYFE